MSRQARGRAGEMPASSRPGTPMRARQSASHACCSCGGRQQQGVEQTTHPPASAAAGSPPAGRRRRRRPCPRRPPPRPRPCRLRPSQQSCQTAALKKGGGWATWGTQTNTHTDTRTLRHTLRHSYTQTLIHSYAYARMSSSRGKHGSEAACRIKPHLRVGPHRGDQHAAKAGEHLGAAQQGGAGAGVLGHVVRLARQVGLVHSAVWCGVVCWRGRGRVREGFGVEAGKLRIVG